MRRTYLYKLTSDRGGAPCAVEPGEGERALLTLAICKPAIRRTAQAGDRLIGITSHSLARSDGYPLGAVIYAAVVAQGVEARDYFAPEGEFCGRPDCIYEFHQQMGTAAHRGLSGLHRGQEHLLKDLGRYPFYKNGRILLSYEFRYLGGEAMVIPERLRGLRAAAESLGQGHRVYTEGDVEFTETDALIQAIWRKKSRFTPREVDGDAYDHSPRRRKPDGGG